MNCALPSRIFKETDPHASVILYLCRKIYLAVLHFLHYILADFLHAHPLSFFPRGCELFLSKRAFRHVEMLLRVRAFDGWDGEFHLRT